MTEATQSGVTRLPLLNKMLFASDHVGLQAIGYFRQSWILFFLVPPLGEGIARVPDIAILGFDVDARVFAGFLIFAGRLHRRLHRPAHRLVERPDEEPVGKENPIHPVQHAFLCSVRGDGLVPAYRRRQLVECPLLRDCAGAVFHCRHDVQRRVGSAGAGGDSGRLGPDEPGGDDLPVRHYRRRPWPGHKRRPGGRRRLSGSWHNAGGAGHSFSLRLTGGGVETRASSHDAGQSQFLAGYAGNGTEPAVRLLSAHLRDVHPPVSAS